MANYSSSRWDAFKYKLNAAMQAPEFRKSPSPTLEKLLKNTQFLVPASELERMLGVKQSDQDTVAIKIINKQSITTGSARAYNHSGNKNDSTSVNATFTTYTANFGYSLKESDRTIWELAEIQSKQILSAIIALHESVETGLVAWLNTNKSQVVQSLTPRSGTWDATNHKFQVANTDYNRWMQRVKGFMREQKYQGLYEMIADEVLFQEGEYLIQQGQGNSTNLAWQGNGIDAMVSQDVTVDTNSIGAGFLFPQGTVGILPWIPKLNRREYGEAGLVSGFYTSLSDPFGTGLQFAVHERQETADNNETSGETEDVNVYVEISVDLAPIKSPMSTANASPVFKFDVLQ
jgi:hypothetical protein